MKKILLLVFIVFMVISCAVFDGISDVSISVNVPDQIIVVNNARVSTLRSMDGKIVRAGTSVYQFHFDLDIPAGHQESIKVNDFIMQEEDVVSVTDANFSWDM